MRVTRPFSGGWLTLLVGLTLAPPAFACSLCTEAVLGRRWWWFAAPPRVALFVAADALLWLVVTLVRRRPVRGQLVSWGLGLGLVLPLGLFAPSVGFAGLAVPLVARLAFSARPASPERLAARVRLAVLAGLAALTLFAALPSRRPTGDLLRLASVNPRLDWSPGPSNWVERELAGRRDAVPLLEASARSSVEPGERTPGQRSLALLRLHQLAGGSPAFRADLCAAWDFGLYAKEYRQTYSGEKSPPEAVARRLCGDAAR